MGFATDAQVEDFFRDVPEFERMLVRSGVVLVKYWFKAGRRTVIFPRRFGRES